jgi:hypothetical protein
VGDRISTWDELIAYLEATHTEVRSHPGNHCRCSFDFDGTPVPIGFYSRRSVSRTPWLSVNVKLCPIDNLRTRSALIANVDMPIGGLCLIPQFSALHQTLPLTNLRIHHLEHTMRSMAALRARLLEVSREQDVDSDTPFAKVFR